MENKWHWAFRRQIHRTDQAKGVKIGRLMLKDRRAAVLGHRVNWGKLCVADSLQTTMRRAVAWETNRDRQTEFIYEARERGRCGLVTRLKQNTEWHVANVSLVICLINNRVIYQRRYWKIDIVFSHKISFNKLIQFKPRLLKFEKLDETFVSIYRAEKLYIILTRIFYFVCSSPVQEFAFL